MQVENSNHLCQAWGYLARDTKHIEASYCLLGVCETLRDFKKVCSMSPRHAACVESHW